MDFGPIDQPIGQVHQQQQQQEQQQQQDPGADAAPQACASCRKQKRKCDKKLPSCGLCQRIGRLCDYRPDAPVNMPSPEDFVALQQQVADLEHLLRSGVNTGSTPPVSNGHGSSHGSMTVSNNNSPANDAPGVLSPGGQPAWQPPSSFPPIYFLDSNAFMYEKLQVSVLSH